MPKGLQNYIRDILDKLRDIARSCGRIVRSRIPLGYIQYMDGNGIVQYTAFCRLFNVQKEHFVPVDDPDYRYAD